MSEAYQSTARSRIILVILSILYNLYNFMHVDIEKFERSLTFMFAIFITTGPPTDLHFYFHSIYVCICWFLFNI